MKRHTRSAGVSRTFEFNRFQRTSMILAAAAVAVGARTASAADVVWDGGGATADWTDGINWVGDAAPVAADALFFGAAPVTTSNNTFAAGTSFGGITFTSASPGHTLNGNQITLSGNISTLAEANVVHNVNLALILDANRNLNAGFQGVLNIGGVISGSGFGINKTGQGAVTLTAANTYTGTTRVTNGTLTLGAGGSIPLSSALATHWGTFAVNGVSHTANGTTLNTGYGGLSATNGTLALGTLTRAGFGSVNFTLGAGGAITTERTNSYGTILAPWATVGNNTWATSAATEEAPGAVTGLSTYTTSFTAGVDVDINATGFTAGAGALSINSLRVSSAGASTTTLNAATALTIASGGILTAPGSQGSAINGGTITSATGELVVVGNHTGSTLDIGSQLVGNMGFTLTGNNQTRVTPTNNANTFTGPINLVNGRLSNGGISNNGQLGNTANVVIVHGNENGGGQFFQGNVALPNTRNFQLSGFGYAEGGGSFGAMRARNGVAGTITLTGDARIGTSNGVTITGKISGPHKLFLNNNSATNNFTLSNATNDWSGGTMIERGKIVMGNAAALPASTFVTFGTTFSAADPFRPQSANAPVLDLNGLGATIAGAALQAGDAGAAGANITNLHAANAATLTFNSPSSFTYGGTITNGPTASVALTKTGAGAATLSGANTYTGATNINGGALKIATGGSLGATVIGVNAGGTFDVSDFTGGGGYNIPAGQTVAANGGTVSGALNVTAGTLAGTASTAGVTMSGTGSIRPGATSADGAVGTLTLASLASTGGDMRFDLIGAGNADAVNVTGIADFSGTATTISVVPGAAIGSYTLLSAGTLSLGTQPTLSSSTFGRTNYALAFTTNQINLNVTGGPASIVWNNAGNGAPTDGLTWDETQNNWKNAGVGDKYFAGDVVTFNDANNGNYTVSIPANVSPLGVTVDNSAGNYVFNGTGTTGFGGAWTLVKSGTGSLTLNTVNTHSGGTTVNGGTVAVNTATALGTGTLRINGGGLANTSVAAVTLSTNNTQVWNGNFSFTGPQNLNLGTGAVALDASPTIDVTAGVLRVGGPISNGTAGTGITKTGAGTLALTGANSFTGDVNVNAGILTVGPSAGANTGAGVNTAGTKLNVASGATLNLGGGYGGANVNLGQREVRIAGTGVGGIGAITNRNDVTLTTPGANQQDALQRVFLVDHASVGGPANGPDNATEVGRIDIRTGTAPTPEGVYSASLNLNGKNLTKFGNNKLTFVNADVAGTGNIFVPGTEVSGANAGSTIIFEAGSRILDDGGTSKLIFGDETILQFWNTSTTGATSLTRRAEMGNGGVNSQTYLASGGGSVANPSTSGVPLHLKSTLIVRPTYGNQANTDLNVMGNITQDATARKLRKLNGATLILSGVNSFTGGLEISPGYAGTGSAGTGTIRMGSATALHAANRLEMIPFPGSTAQFQLNGFGTTVAGLQAVGLDTPAQAIVENVNATNATLAINNTVDSTFDGTIRNGTGAGTLGLTKAGAGAQTLTAANTYSGDTTINGGALVIANQGNLGTSTNAIQFGGGTLRATAGIAFTRNAATNTGGGTIETSADSSIGTITGTGGFAKTGAGKLTANQVKVAGPLAVSGGGSLEVVAEGGATGTVEATALSITGAALRLNDNDLIVNYSGASPEGAIRQYVKDGRVPAATSGIFSTPGSPDDDVVLAIADNTAWGKSAFNGINIDTDTVVGKYTYFGDANLDGKVTGDDYVSVDANLGTGDSWLEGDFNMNGVTTGDDYVAIDANLGKGTPTPLAYAELKEEMVAQHVAMFGEEYLVLLAQAEAEGFGASVVPEPAAISLLGLGAVGLLGRRRRRA